MTRSRFQLIFLVREKAFLSNLPRRCGKKGYGSSTCLKPSNHGALVEGDLLSVREYECRVSVGISKSMSDLRPRRGDSTLPTAVFVENDDGEGKEYRRSVIWYGDSGTARHIMNTRCGM